ncbi:hypothetical protein CSC70_04860 [Pseudoxanthomonas kalamensis DSM 18571]|nr:hypothetical protein CSC70_04860 [Pseudoxanthomonas kalamensis DSM 18571]
MLSLVIALALPGAFGQVVKSPQSLTPRAAQTIQSAQIRPPAVGSGVKVPAPPKTLMLPKPPPLSATQRRKLTTLRAWGLNVGASALKPSILLAPQQPYLASGAQLMMMGGGGQIDYNSSEGMPYGQIAGARSILLANLPAAPRDWLLLECYVEGEGNLVAMDSYVRSPRGEYGSSTGGTGRWQPLPPAPGSLVSFVLEPNTSRERAIQLIPVSGSRGAGGSGYRYGGCEITPVNP